jgi:hypothetical protein
MGNDASECHWYQDYDSDMWTPSCGGGTFRIDDGGPAENRMLYCCRCGKPLVEHFWEWMDQE